MRKNILFIALVVCFTKIVSGQTKEIRLMLGGGTSTNGSGDMRGYCFFNQVDIQLNKRFYISPGIQFTNHPENGNYTGEYLNYITSGVDVFTNINYLIINNIHHHIAIGAGPLIRFQTSNVPDYDNSDLHTTSIGFDVAPSYYYQCNNKLLFGAKFSFQNDTNGDVITTATAFVGVRL